MKNRKGSGKFAHVSTMRKLIRMIFTMLKERKEWKYENPGVLFFPFLDKIEN